MYGTKQVSKSSEAPCIVLVNVRKTKRKMCTCANLAASMCVFYCEAEKAKLIEHFIEQSLYTVYFMKITSIQLARTLNPSNVSNQEYTPVIASRTRMLSQANLRYVHCSTILFYKYII